jgi:hypothetical protein
MLIRIILRGDIWNNLPRPARVCIVAKDGTVLYEKPRYTDDRKEVRNLSSIVKSSTVGELVQMYDLPVQLH